MSKKTALWNPHLSGRAHEIVSDGRDGNVRYGDTASIGAGKKQHRVGTHVGYAEPGRPNLAVGEGPRHGQVNRNFFLAREVSETREGISAGRVG